MGDVTMRSGPARGKIEWDIFNLAILWTNEAQHDKNVLTRPSMGNYLRQENRNKSR